MTVCAVLGAMPSGRGAADLNEQLQTITLYQSVYILQSKVFHCNVMA